MKNKDNPTAAGYLKQIDEVCSHFRGTNLYTVPFHELRLFDETGDRSAFENTYFARRRRMTFFMLRVWLYHEKEDIAELEDILWSVCDEYSWALAAHMSGIMTDDSVSPDTVDLFAAETANTVAETLSLVGDELHPLVKKRCIQKVFEHVLEPFESGDEKKYRLWWQNAYGNWAAVCGGGVGMAALYLIEDEARLRKIVDRCKKACANFIASCAEDGTCMEGITYWDYAMQYYVSFDELLRARLGEGMEENTEKLKKIAAFPSAACLENNIPVSFSDCGVEHPNMRFGILCRLKDIYGVSIPAAAAYEQLSDNCCRTAGMVRSIAWFNDAYLREETERGDVFLPDGKWSVNRVKDRTLVIKGGHNNEPHNHNDIGSYIYISGGKIIAADLGAPQYCADFFGEKRYTFLNASSRGHSVPVINGVWQHEGEEYRADLFAGIEHGAELSFAKAYPAEAGVQSLVRRAYLEGDSGVLSVEDDYRFGSRKNRIVNRVVTKYDACADGGRVLIKDADEVIAVISSEGCPEIKVTEEYYKKHTVEKNENGGFEHNYKVCLIDFIYEDVPEEYKTKLVIE